MASCASSGNHHDLVVNTGLQLRLPRLDMEMVQEKRLYVIGLDNLQENPFISEINKEIQNNDKIRTSFVINGMKSILDIHKDYRSNSIIICYDEPSYNGKQSLYRTFWTPALVKRMCSEGIESYEVASYQTFTRIMGEVHKNGDAIVFGGEEVMWFPGPKSLEIPEMNVNTHIHLNMMLILYNKVGSKNFFENVIKKIVAEIKNTHQVQPSLLKCDLDSISSYSYNIPGFCKKGSFEYIDNKLITHPSVWLMDTSGNWNCRFYIDGLADTFVKSVVEMYKKSFPAPTPEFPENEIQTPYGKREEFGVQAGPNSAYKLIPISLLFGSLKAWVLKAYPETQFVNMGPMMGVQEGMMWRIWGWNTLPTEYVTRNANWDQFITALKPKVEPKPQPTPEFPMSEWRKVCLNNTYTFAPLSTKCVFDISACKIFKTTQFGKWVLDNYPDTNYVYMVESDNVYTMLGWKTLSDICEKMLPFDFKTMPAYWRTEFKVKNEIVASKPDESDTKAQLAAIAESLKTLTAAVAALAAKS